MTSKSPASRPSSHASRLLLPAHVPPPPIPPRLLSRLHEPRKNPPPPNAMRVWIDEDEFALALSASKKSLQVGDAPPSRKKCHQRMPSISVPSRAQCARPMSPPFHIMHSTGIQIALPSTSQSTPLSSRRLPPKSSRSSSTSRVPTGTYAPAATPRQAQ